MRGFSYIVSILFTHVKPVKSLRPYARKNYATVEIHLYFVDHAKLGKILEKIMESHGILKAQKSMNLGSS